MREHDGLLIKTDLHSDNEGHQFSDAFCWRPPHLINVLWKLNPSCILHSMTWQSQKFHTKRRQRIYVGGSISLLLLFPLLMFQLHQYKAFEKHRVMEVTWYSPTSLYLPDSLNPPIPKNRNFTTFNLSGNERDDNLKLDFAQLAVRELIQNPDTINAVRIHFADSSKYESFIRALTICQKEKVRFYIAYQSDLWIYGQIFEPPPENNRRFGCGTSQVLTVDARPAFFPLVKQHLELWPIALGLIVLTVTSIKGNPISLF